LEATLNKRYKIAICRECLGFGIELTTDEYIEFLGRIIKSSIARRTSPKDGEIRMPTQKFAVLQRAPGETKRCRHCEGTGWIFSDTPGAHVIPDITWRRR
jgi:Ribonuclease G/E